MVTAQRYRHSTPGEPFDPPSEGDGEADLHFDNSGRCNLSVPGFGYAESIERTPDQRFAHGFNDWAQDRLTAREIAMLALMDVITDKPGWNVDVHNPAIVTAWAEDALKRPLISHAAWEWCLAELRDKAHFYKDTSLIHVYDAASRICKSDSLIAPALLERVASEVGGLAAEGVGLVDPDMFPLVYGHTQVFSKEGRVMCLNAVESVGQGAVSHRPKRSPPFTRGRRRGRYHRGVASYRHSWEPRAFRFSHSYQWLPCEVELVGEGSEAKNSSRVRISSYINNLHPRRHRPLYETIERCIEASIPAWNEVLVWRSRWRTPDRIRTFGVEWDPPFPQWAENLDQVSIERDRQAYEEAREKVQAYIAQPDNPHVAAIEPSYSLGPGWEAEHGLRRAMELKYNLVKAWLHPEPGTAFTYDEWKQGKNNGAVVNGRNYGPGTHGELPPKDDHEFYTVSLADLFRQQGLQVVVEIGSIDLTPEQPLHPATDWTLSGTLNEHIVATSVLYFSSDNVTSDSGALSFRVEADLFPPHFHFGPATGSAPYHPLRPLADVFGVSPPIDLGDNGERTGGAPALQVLGTVQCPDSRLLAFPNTLQHRVKACRLADPTRPGRRRFLKLHLVDPHYRICSTRNVPPQRHDWWADAALDRIDWGGTHELPPELVEEILKGVGEWPLGLNEARRHRYRAKKERREIHERVKHAVERYRFGDWCSEGPGWGPYQSSDWGYR